MESVADESVKGFRLVILDNASTTDNSGVVAQYKQLCPEHVINSQNLGSVGNICKAVADYADRDYLTVFHDDDVMHSRLLQLELEVLRSDPEIQWVATELVEFNDENHLPEGIRDGSSATVTVFEDTAQLVREFLGGSMLCFDSTMYRASSLKGATLDAEKYSIYCDRPFLVDVARQGKCALVRAPLVRYRLHPEQDTNTGRLNVRNLIELMLCYRRELPVELTTDDAEFFYGRSAKFLVAEYPRLARQCRPGGVGFLFQCRSAGVLRLRDIGFRDSLTLARADGWGRWIDAALQLKRWLSRS